MSIQNKPKRFFLKPLATAILTLSISAPVLADFDEFNDSVENVLKFGQDENKYGQVQFDLRYRYENANEENVTRDTANANTMRLRLGYLTPEFFGVQGFAEYEGNLAMQEDYNSVRNGQTQYSVIADPEKQELNRLWMTYKGIPDTEIKGGRQRIKIDDDRFIGNVGWRQMEQTFDSAVITNESLPNTTIKAGYIGRVKTILSTTETMTTPFVNVGYKIKDFGKLTAYGYWLDYDEAENFGKSSQTYGLRFNGDYVIQDNIKALYTAEWSFQKDYEDNPNDYEVDRINLMAGFTAFGVTGKGGMEQLGGRGAGQRFLTPLGTNHAFQGWADKFLVTPNDGIRDIYGSLSTKFYGTKFGFIYHSFNDDTSNINYGDEYDFVVAKKFGKHYSLLAKYAYYDADQFSTNTQKVWVQGNVSF